MRPRFAQGEQVAVRQAWPRTHCRTPFYCRGKTGVVERLCGAFRNPQELAYSGDGLPKVPLYRVRFRQCDLWPGYGGKAEDTVDIELYEFWLEPAA
jgi:nitrile hydratase